MPRVPAGTISICVQIRLVCESVKVTSWSSGRMSFQLERAVPRLSEAVKKTEIFTDSPGRTWMGRLTSSGASNWLPAMKLRVYSRVQMQLPVLIRRQIFWKRSPCSTRVLSGMVTSSPKMPRSMQVSADSATMVGVGSRVSSVGARVGVAGLGDCVAGIGEGIRVGVVVFVGVWVGEFVGKGVLVGVSADS